MRSKPVQALASVAAIALLGVAGCRAAAKRVPQDTLALARERGVLRVGIRADNPPHSFIDSSGQWVGFDVDIAGAIAKSLDLRLEKIRVDELTRISFLRSGKIDLAVASISKTWKRQRAIHFSQTYFWSKQTFLVRKEEIRTLHDLAGKRVGVDRGSSAAGNWRTWLSRNAPTALPDIVEFGDKRAAAEAVAAGAIAGWAEDYEILTSYAKGNPRLQVLSEASIGVKLDGVGVRKNDSRIREAVDRALQRIEASGDYAVIYDRWFGPGSLTPVPRQGRIEVWPEG